MKLTPLDIHHKEFRHSLRGYAEEEVDQFLDEVADEFERVFKESIDTKEQLDAANHKLNEFELQRQTINNTLMAAQRSAEDIVASAHTDAETMLRDAEIKAKEIIHGALTQKQQVQGELIRIKQAEEEFRDRLSTMLDSYRSQIEEVSLPGDVQVLIAESEAGTIADVDVSPSPIDEVFAAPATEPAPAPVERAEPAPEPVAMTAEEMPTAPVADTAAAEPGQAAPLFEMVGEAPEAAGAPAEPQAASYEPVAGEASVSSVESISLGELESPEIPAEPVELGEPPEFAVPTFDALGDREDDIDIEEID